MATRCYIGFKNLDGSIRAVYSHWDGYPDKVGSKLLSSYNTPEKINALLDMGNISSLEGTLETSDFYREIGEEFYRNIIKNDISELVEEEAKTYINENEFNRHCSEDYTYLYDGLKWLVRHWNSPYEDLSLDSFKE
jgi:hypothetical protein